MAIIVKCTPEKVCWKRNLRRMLTIALEFAIISALLVVIRHKNKTVWALVLHMLGMLLMLITSFMYYYKMQMVYFPTGIEKRIFSVLTKIPANITDISRMFNVGVALVMLGSFFVCGFGSRQKMVKWILLLPVLFYLIVNDYTVNLKLFIWQYTTDYNISLLTGILLWIGNAITFVYWMIPVIYFGWNVFWAKIFSMARAAGFYFLYFLVANGYLYLSIMIQGIVNPLTYELRLFEFSMFMPNERNIHILKSTIVPVLIIMLVFICIFNPFKEMHHPGKRKMKRQIADFKQSYVYQFKMILHKHKNIFVAFDKMAEQTLRKLDDDPEEAKKMLHLMRKMSNELIHDLAKTTRMMDEGLQLHSSVNNILEPLNSAITDVCIPEDIRLIKEYTAKVTDVLCDSQLMTEVFINLLQNAMEAMEQVDDKVITIRVFNEQKFAVIEITDNGCGLPDHIRKEVFKPLFSTKSGGKNSGMGLYLCRKIIHLHHGEIMVKSVVNKYTTFQIILPIQS